MTATTTLCRSYASLPDHGVAVLLVHHLRKADSDDAFDTVSGTLGLTGSVDSVIVLRRESNGNISCTPAAAI